MALLEIRHYPDRILLEVGKPVEEPEFGNGLRDLVENMFETMDHSQGVGLAAPQVGDSKRLFVMDCSGEEDGSGRIAVINPEIIRVSGEQYGDEGCLSFPGIYTKVQREMTAVVRYQDLTGETHEREFTDLEARCFLHENDHCDGIVFLDRMSSLKRELAKRKIRKLRRTGEWD